MTKPKLVFSPVSQEYFDNPYEIYKRMRDEAPIYYDEDEDFYALTRHEDVAAAFKDHDSFSSARGCDLGMVRDRASRRRSRSSSWTRPTTGTCAACSTRRSRRARSSRSGRPSIELVEHYLRKADPDNFDVVQDFSGPFPVEVITRMAGVPEEFRQQVRHWIDKSLHRKPGQIDLDDDNMQANIDSGMYYYGLVQERRENPQDDMISRLIAAEIPDDERRDAQARRHRDHRLHHASRRRGRRDGHQAGRQRGGRVRPASRAVADAARRPQQDSRRRRGTAALRRPGAVQRPLQHRRTSNLPSGTIPAHKPVFLMGASANRDPRAFDDGETFDITRDRTQAQNLGLGYGIHSCLGAALARMESAIALDHLLDFMPRYEVDFDGLQRVNMQNVAGYHHVPVKVSDEE